MSRETLSLSEQYIQKHFCREDEDLVRVRERLIADGKFGINVGSSEGKFLQFLVGLTRPKRIVEIGVLYGYSTLWMAKALDPDGQIVAIEKDEKNFKVAQELIGQSQVCDRVILRQGDAREILKDLDFKPDFIFIDADKGGYREYLDWAMAQVQVGGLIVGDNTFLFGHIIGEDRGERASAAALAAMTYFNETLARSPHFRAVMVPSHEGITLAQRLS
jgi:predicted O-methyltransferase YrrM